MTSAKDTRTRFTLKPYLGLCVVAVIAMAAAAQKTPDGRPDLQGIWTNVTVTPFERPAEFKDKAFFTPAEAAAFEKQVIERNNADRRDGGPEADVGRAY